MGDKPSRVESQNKSYKIIDTLGEGGTSVVYLANDGSRDVALKIIGEEVDPSFKDKYVEILKNEFEVLSKLRHPNIAEVYDFEFSQELGKYFFTTEYVKGADLYNFTANADYRTKEDLFVQLLLALDYVHKSGLIHCDVKCGNALVTQVKKTPIVKLVDFGFATRGLSTSGNVVGTAHYLAPELLVSERSDVDHRVDVYAAGVLFYRLLHRAYPYEAAAINDIIKWHKEKTPVAFSDDVPEYAKQLILKMIETYPSDRIVSCGKAIEFINFRTEGRYKKVVEKIATLQFKEGPLVARQDAIEAAGRILADIKAKRTPASAGIMFIGPQGIGKSRVLNEIKYRAELDEIPIKEFTCVEGRDMVEGFFERFKEIKGSEEHRSADTEDKKKLVEVNWINALLEHYKEKGLVLIMDDIQFADSAFIKFVSLIEERVKVKSSEAQLPVGFLIGSRPEADMQDVVLKWYGRSQHPKRVLSIFKKEDIKRYAEGIGIADLSKHVEGALSFSGGVPGLVEAYFQHVLSPAASGKLPESLAQSYLARVKGISKDARALLEFLSVARRDMVAADLEFIVSKDKDSVMKLVQELGMMGLAALDYSTMSVSIANKALAQVIKSNLKPERLKEAASALGGWLEVKEPSTVAEIAEYYDEGGVAAKALAFAELAGKYFEERFNNSEAARYYDIALKYAGSEAKKRELIRAGSKAGILMGNYKGSIEKLERLLKDGDSSLENYRLLGMAYAKMRDFENANKWYETGLGKMTDETAINDIVQFKNSLGNVSFYMGNLEKSEKYFTEAIADATVCLLLNNNLGLILSAKGRYDEAIQFYDARKRYLAAKQNKRALSLCHSECGYIHMINNKFDMAIKELEESYRLASEIGDWYNILIIVGNLVRCFQQTAKYSKALDYALKGLEAEGTVGSIDEIAQNHLTIGSLYETIGILDLSLQHVNMAMDRFAAVNNKAMLGWCHLILAYIHKDTDKFGDASKELDEAEKIAAETKSNELDQWAKCSKADLIYEYGKPQEAATIVNKLKPPYSKEFELRKELLELKTGIVPESEKGQRLDALVTKSGDFPELIWEIHAAKGAFFEKAGKFDEALACYKRAFEAIQSVASNLSEAYRDSYKSQRFRLRIVEKFQPDFMSKTFKPKPGAKAEVFEGKTSEVK